MKKIINLQLYKNIIESDFFILNSRSKQTNNCITTSINKIEHINFQLLNVFHLVNTLKQFIRVFQFIKEKNFYCLHIQIDNAQHYQIITNYFNNHPLKFNIKISKNFNNQEILKNQLQMVLFLNQSAFLKNSTLLRRLFFQKVFLISQINSKLETTVYNSYKLYNDIFDFKKIIFIITLLDQIFNEKDENN